MSERSNQPEIFIPTLSFLNAQQEGARGINCNPDQLTAMGTELHAAGARKLADTSNLSIILWRHSIDERDPMYHQASPQQLYVPAGRLAATNTTRARQAVAKSEIDASGREVLEVQVGGWLGSLTGHVALALLLQPPERIHTLTNPLAWLQMTKEALKPTISAGRRKELKGQMELAYPAALTVVR